MGMVVWLCSWIGGLIFQLKLSEVIPFLRSSSNSACDLGLRKDLKKRGGILSNPFTQMFLAFLIFNLT